MASVNQVSRYITLAKRRGSGRATIYDAAQHAQIGAITASRMLRDPSRVSVKLESRIEHSIRALD